MTGMASVSRNSWVSIMISILFLIIFDERFGLMNGMLSFIQIAPINWLGDPDWAKITIALIIVWRWTGYLMIFFLAGLQGIPRDLYEAAKVDGAGTLAQFFYITLPLLRPVTAFIAIVVLIGSAQIFEEPFILTQGGPGDATLSTAMFIYQEGLFSLRLGYASAASVVLFVVILTLTLLMTRFFGVGRDH